jgi:protein-disulfide isomerase
VTQLVKSGLLAAAMLAAAVLGGCGDSSAVPSGSSVAPITIKPTDIVKGNPNAAITMVEYASMTCHHCADWQRDVFPKLDAAYIRTGKIRYIFREFPLDAAARMASALARCQKGEGFFSFVDHLFLNQERWIDLNGDKQMSQEEVTQGLVQMSRVAGLSEQQAKACMGDPKNLAVVDENWQEAQTLYNVQGTPTFVLGDTIHRRAWKWEELDAKLKAMLAQRGS